MAKTAVVTGGSRGIGRAIAVKLAKDGFNVAIIFQGNEAKALETKELCENEGREARIYKCDVSNYQEAEEVCKTIQSDFGSIDVMVNNAGITRDGLLVRMKEEDFDAVINTNLKGCFNFTKCAGSIMLKQKAGRIVNISSVSGLLGNAGQANYSASKAGVIGLTKSSARELASRGITVNAVAPGYVQTDMTDVLSDKVKEALLGSIPLKRYGEVEDIANAVSFLVSDGASYITGQVLSVDGGMYM